MRPSLPRHLPRIFRSSPRLPNTGSTARDHLASERTFLAWTRTGLGFTALGIALERFSALDPSLRTPPPPPPPPVATTDSSTSSSPSSPSTAHPHHVPKSLEEVEAEREREHLLVGALLGMGAGSIVYASARYFSNLRLLEAGVFKPSYWGAAGLSVGVAGLAGGAYVGALRERWKGRDRAEERREREEAWRVRRIGHGPQRVVGGVVGQGKEEVKQKEKEREREREKH